MLKHIPYFIFFGALYLSFRDILRNENSNGVDASSEDSPASPLPHMKKSFMGPSIKFLFCYSCGYRRAFDEFSQVLRERYPSLNIQGENFSPPPIRAISAQVLSVAKLVFIAIIISGQNPFPMLGMNTPGVFTWAIQNKIYACMMIFFLSNTIESQLISTGAFEILFNDELIWSKLDAGRIPSPQELVQIIESHLNLNGPATGSFSTRE